MQAKSEWFNTWFDSQYYPILYCKRDFDEAREFIDSLDEFLQFQNGQQVLDAACGRGRHSIYLNEKGLKVTGIDISEKSIAFAKQYENETLLFQLHDIRKPLVKNQFDFVFNLFTSFGYFDEEEDNFKTIQAFYDELKPGGYLVLDFFNPEYAVKNLVLREVKEECDIRFNINRNIEGDFLIKEIEFEDQGKKLHFYEKVKLIRKDQFLKYFNFAGFEVRNVFGNYFLDEFHEEESERMIFIAQKNK